MAVVAGCQEVQGACLEGCLGKACGGFEGGQTAALNAVKNRWPWSVVAGCQEVQGACLEGCLGKACGGFGAF